ncbi:peptidase S41-like protein [Chitinophaga dinghuensis]|uniref:Peptidase S41-like protein n=1 Tax=Chitinophaga dinghuensis TaxID=1539050 RepID=A0A327W5H3_9BACT|nr:S41 family peptidase [Chitinophaga dinghuensis]RAJ80238.1 peptidase S41-like protein [Chitinophaga dinghuensis]
MRKLFFCALLFMSSSALYAQKALFDSVFTLVKEKSIFAANVNWDTITPKVYAQFNAAPADSISSIFPAFALLMQEMKDVHSGMSYKGKGYGNPDTYALVRSKVTKEMKEAYQKGYGDLHTAILDGGYGYIAVPEALIQHTEDMQQVFKEITLLAQRLSDSLYKLQNMHPKGIIIDLRLNTGGSTPAIIGGLASLFQDGMCFSFVKGDKSRENIVFKKGNLFYDTTQITRMNLGKVPKGKVKVAVLISGFTTSAGEHTAIALKSLPNTRFFGSPTRGQITGNETIFLRKDLVISLSTAWAEDGIGRRYMTDVVPDETIGEGADFEQLNNDKSVQAAIKWLAAKK